MAEQSPQHELQYARPSTPHGTSLAQALPWLVFTVAGAISVFGNFFLEENCIPHPRQTGPAMTCMDQARVAAAFVGCIGLVLVVVCFALHRRLSLFLAAFFGLLPVMTFAIYLILGGT